MTIPEERIKIAKFCGYVETDERSFGKIVWISPDGKKTRFLPNYHMNLNAMHEAEKRLRTVIGDESDRLVSISNLSDSAQIGLYPRMVAYEEHLNYCVDSDAPTRVKAYLNTIG